MDIFSFKFVWFTSLVALISICMALPSIVMIQYLIFGKVKVKFLIQNVLIFVIVQIIFNLILVNWPVIKIYQENLLEYLLYVQLPMSLIQNLLICIQMWRKERGNIIKLIATVFFVRFFLDILIALAGDAISLYVEEYTNWLVDISDAYFITLVRNINIASHISAALMMGVVIKLMTKARLYKTYDSLFRSNGKAVSMLLVSMFLYMFYDFFDAVFGVTKYEFNLYYILFGFFLTIFILLALIIQSISESYQIELSKTNMMLLEKEMQVKTLENIQKEFRTFRHDFKNLISGVYLTTMDGNQKQVIDFFERTEEYFQNKLEPTVKIEKQKEAKLVLFKSVWKSLQRSTYKLVNMKNGRVYIACSFCLLFAAFTLLSRISFIHNIAIELSVIILAIVLLVAMIVLRVRVVSEFKTKLEIQEFSLEHQDAYIMQLQDIQEIISPMIEEYREMLAKLKHDASVGKFEELQILLNDNDNYYDKRIQEEVKRTSQLKNIMIIEMRSMLLSKLIEMNKHSIPFQLEIVEPIDKVNMDLSDLNRCLGILIDNAIEEVIKVENGYIKIILLKDEKNLNVIIENNIQKEVPIKNIWDEGFSTKGERRGYGLASYKEITNLYSNVFSSTMCKDATFIQDLKIGY